MISKKRHALNDRSIRAGTLLSSWVKSGISILLPEAELTSSIKAKARRPKKAAPMVGPVESEDVESLETEDM